MKLVFRFFGDRFDFGGARLMRTIFQFSLKKISIVVVVVIVIIVVAVVTVMVVVVVVAIFFRL